jgi:hypothetical protein
VIDRERWRGVDAGRFGGLRADGRDSLGRQADVGGHLFEVGQKLRQAGLRLGRARVERGDLAGQGAIKFARPTFLDVFGDLFRP